MFGSSVWTTSKPEGEAVVVDGQDGVVHSGGLLVKAGDGKLVNIERLKIGTKMLPASKFGQSVDDVQSIEFTAEEIKNKEVIRTIWHSILNIEIEDETDFFASGAGSMDVVRLVEEVKDNFGVSLQNTDVFMAPTFQQFNVAVALAGRGAASSKDVKYDAVHLHVNNMDIKFPRQLFVNGQFINGEGKPLPTVNPHDETVICTVENSSVADVDRAVKAAKAAFEEGEWSKISARDRGALLFK